MSVGRDHLLSVYAQSSDPWNFATSAYEQQKFAATCDALLRPRYRAAFELGCGNGQLARHLVGRCDRYTGMDAVAVALEAARRTVPQARFVQGFYPCPLPGDGFDLLILSEILYFLDARDLRRLAGDIAAQFPLAEVICVTWLGPTGHELQGEQALAIFAAALETHDFTLVTRHDRYRIDRALPKKPV